MDTFQKSLLAVVGAGVLLIALVLVFVTPVRYQTAEALVAARSATVPAGGGPTPGVLTVGEATVKVKPDIALLSIGVTAQAPTAAEAQSQVADRIARVIQRAKALGISDADMKNAGYNINPQYGSRGGPGGPPVIMGYQATQTIALTYRKVDEVGKALDALVQNEGATNVSIRLTLDDTKGPQGEARKLAIADAKAKAQAMTDAAGVRLGKAVSITDVNQAGSIGLTREIPAPGPTGASFATAIPTGDLDIVVRVQVQYAID